MIHLPAGDPSIGIRKSVILLYSM